LAGRWKELQTGMNIQWSRLFHTRPGKEELKKRDSNRLPSFFAHDNAMMVPLASEGLRAVDQKHGKQGHAEEHGREADEQKMRAISQGTEDGRAVPASRRKR
jgi:hypothetical protein